MASAERLECDKVTENGVVDCNGGLGDVKIINIQKTEDVEEIVHEVDMFLEELEDTDDLLAISRMVSDSVMKGIVTAISQEAAEAIAAKEREVAYLSKGSCCRRCNSGEISEPEKEIHGEVEGAVFGAIVQGLREEHERRVLNADSVLAFIDRCKEISSLRLELQSIQKNLISHEVLSPQGSLDADIFHRKVFSNHNVHSGGLWDGNGKCEESEMNMPETFEKSKLSHMSKQELYKFFRTEINQMKRDHESTVHQMTEEYFRLRRESMKERDPSKEKGPFAVRKDKEFESLRKKLMEVISRLDDILKENEKLSEFCNHSRDTLNSLVSENRRLCELLNSQKLEACSLAMQASDATEKSAQHLAAEENLQMLVGDLTSSLEDARLEASISDEVYKCILTELIAQEKSDDDDDDLDLKSLITQEIIGTIYEEAFHGTYTAREPEYGETSDLMFDFMQQVYSVIFQEVAVDISMELDDWKNKSLRDNESLVYLETKYSNIEKDLCMEVEENGNLKHQVSVLENIIEDKDKSLYEVTQELHKLLDLRSQQESLIANREEELVVLKKKLVESQNYADLYMTEVEKLNEKLSIFGSRLRESDEEKARFVSALKQQQTDLFFVKAKEQEHQRQMESFCYVIDGFSKLIADLEQRTNESIGWHSSRLEHAAFQLRSLVPKANILRRTSLLYKERLEKRCSDLQKAEAEVDVLGDEVDTLLRLLEKIYVALDHYSPILQHYPGIIEILKLVKRELSGDAVKVV